MKGKQFLFDRTEIQTLDCWIPKPVPLVWLLYIWIYYVLEYIYIFIFILYIQIIYILCVYIYNIYLYVYSLYMYLYINFIYIYIYINFFLFPFSWPRTLSVNYFDSLKLVTTDSYLCSNKFITISCHQSYVLKIQVISLPPIPQSSQRLPSLD